LSKNKIRKRPPDFFTENILNNRSYLFTAILPFFDFFFVIYLSLFLFYFFKNPCQASFRKIRDKEAEIKMTL